VSTAETALELARLTEAVVQALEGGDLDAAERAVEAREALLAREAGRPRMDGGAQGPAYAAAARAVHEADRRCRELLTANVEALRGELRHIAAGAAALRGYGRAEPAAPGLVDCRD